MQRLLWALMLMLLAASASAAEPVEVRAHAVEAEGTGRILLHPAEPLQYEAELDGTDLVLRFDRPVRTDLAQAVRPLGPLVAGVRHAADHRTVLIRLRRPVTLRTFQSGGPIVVELAAADPVAGAGSAESEDKSGDTPVVRVRSGRHPNFDRVVFDWKQPVDFEVVEGTGTLTVAFAREAALDTKAVDPRHALLVQPSEAIPAEGKTRATILLPAGASYRYFRVGHRVVVDLIRPAGRTAAAAPRKAHGAPSPRAPKVSKAAADHEIPPRPRRKPTLAAAAVPAAPAAPAPEPPPAGAEAEPATTPTGPEAPPAPPGRPTGSTAATSVDETPGEPPVEAPSSAAAPPPAGAPPAPEPAPEPAPAPIADLPPNLDAMAGPAGLRPLLADPSEAVQVRRRGDALSLLFPVPAGTRGAAFRRAGHVWVAFDRPLRLDTSGVVAATFGDIRSVDRIEHPEATLLRFATAGRVELAVRRDDGAWILILGARGAPVADGLAVRRETVAGEGARIVVAAPAPSAPIEFTDPEVGDRLVAVPVASTDAGVADGSSYPEFALLPTAQGVVVAPRSERIRVATRGDAVVVSSERGLYLNDADTLEEHRRGDDLGNGAPRLFAFARWQRPGAPVIAVRQTLHRAVTEAAPDSVNAARMELARFLLARGFATEAGAELSLIAETAPAVLEDPAFRALRGASNAIAGKLPEAAADLYHRSLDGTPEMALWRGFLAAEQGDWAAAVPLLRRGWDVTADYPGWLLERIVPVAAEAAVEQGDARLSESWLERLDDADAGEAVRWRLRYVKGRILAAAGAVGEAVAVWDEVIAGPDRLARAKATLAKIAAQRRGGTLDRAAAIANLERLRFSWRGDRTELEILKELAELYFEQGDFWNGLATLREATTVFAQAPQAEPLRDRMRSAFRALFLEGGAESLPPLRAMALYEAFGDLAPAGAEGDAVIQRLAGRLVTLDLLKPAARLLQRRAEAQSLPAGRAAALNDLALVRLLDRKPDLAIEALDRVSSKALPEEVRQRRRHLRARALFQLGRSAEAMLALEGDHGPQADALRADIQWRAADWRGAAASLARLLGDGPAAGAAPSADQRRTILKLAVARSLAGDEAGVRALAERYGAAMERTPDAAAFRMIAAGQATAGQGIRSISAALAEADDFQAYLRSYREALERPAASAAGAG